MAEPDFTFKMGDDVEFKFDDSDPAFTFVYGPSIESAIAEYLESIDSDEVMY